MTFYFLVQKIKVLFVVPKSLKKHITFAAKFNGSSDISSDTAIMKGVKS